MIFRSLRTQGVASLPDRCWQFQPGLQVVQGPNEAGKTSLRRAITTVLFAAARTRDQKILGLKNWKSEGMRIELEFQHGGEVYRLERDFGQGKEVLEVVDGDERWTHKEQIEHQIRTMLPVPDQAAFTSTLCMSRGDLVIPDAARIHELIEERVLSGSGVNAADLINELEGAHDKRHRGEKHPAKHPGILVQLKTQLDAAVQQEKQVRTALTAAETASGRLSAREQALNAAIEELETLKERQRRHEVFDRARVEYERQAEKLATIIQQMEQADMLEGELKSVSGALQACQEALAPLRKQVLGARERVRLTDELTRANQEAQRLEAQCARISELQAAIESVRVEIERLPLRKDEAENAFAPMPDEIRGLESALEADRVALEKNREEIAAQDEAQREAGALLAGIRRQIDVFSTMRDRIHSLAEIQQDLAKAAQATASAESLSNQLAEAEAQAVELPEQRFRALRTEIQTRQSLLESERLVLRFEPEGDVQLRVRADGGDERAVTGPAGVAFRRSIEMHLPGIGRVVVENHSRAAEQLADAEEEMKTLLASVGVPNAVEFETRAASARQACEHASGLRHKLGALLAGKTLAALQAQTAELQVRIEAGRAELQQVQLANPVSGEVHDRLRELTEEQLSAVKAQEAARARIAALTPSLAGTASMRQNEQELGRKKEKLADLLRRADVTDPAMLASLVESHRQLEETRTKLQQQLGGALAGARPEDVVAARDHAHERRASITGELSRLADLGWDAEMLSAKQAELEQAEASERTLRVQSEAARRLRNGYNVELLKQKRESLVVDLAVLKHNREENEQYQLEPNERLRIERRVKELDKETSHMREQVGGLRHQAAAQEGLAERVLQAEELVESCGCRLDVELSRDDVDEQVRLLLEEARARAVSELRGILPKRIADFLRAATGGRYSEVRGEGLSAAIYSAEKEGPLQEVEVSSGTADQFYLAIRLAAINSLFGGSPPPLLLDDVLVHCDPQRRRALLKVFSDFVGSGQALLFSCHDYPEYKDLPTIQVATAAGAV